MALPPAAEALRQQAERAQARRNRGGALIALSFVSAVFAYSIFVVGSEDNVITEAEVHAFIKQREKERLNTSAVKK